jgi:hypothetical protein
MAHTLLLKKLDMIPTYSVGIFQDTIRYLVPAGTARNKLRSLDNLRYTGLNNCYTKV